MAKTEVILIENIVGLGAESDQVKVAAGYARNYLFPQRLAIPLTAANKKRIEALQKRRGEREAHEYNSMSDLSKSLGKLVCVVKVKTGEDGKMFGSVTAGTIADELKNQFDIALDKRKIHIEHPIRALGEYDIEMRLHSQVNSTLKVRVESSTPLPQSTAEAAPADAKAAGKDAPKGKEGVPARGDRTPRASAEGRPARGPRPPRGDRPPKADKAPKTEKPQ